MIDLSRRNVFVHIPKTGGAVIERWFPRGFRLGWGERGALGSFSNPAHSRLARANQHCTLAQIEDLVFGGSVPDDFRVFTVVRHPERRFLGEWASRKLPPVRLSPIHGRLPAGLLMRPAERSHPRLPDLALHLRPQADYLAGAASADRMRVLRRESVAADFADLQRDWGLDRTPLGRENVSPPRGQMRVARRAAVRDVVARFYAEDFGRFGYDPRAEGPTPEAVRAAPHPA